MGRLMLAKQHGMLLDLAAEAFLHYEQQGSAAAGAGQDGDLRPAKRRKVCHPAFGYAHPQDVLGVFWNSGYDDLCSCASICADF